MDTIIDANIIRRDLKLNDRDFEILSDYLAKTNSKLIFPSIVVEEIKGLYKRALQERFEEYTKSIDKLKSTLLFVEMPETPVIDIEGDSERYIDFLHAKFGTNSENIVPYKNEYLPELVKRAIERKKPLDNKGQQFRDGLLWLTLLDYAESKEEKIVAFISDNPTDFSEKGENKLSKELFEEAKLRGIEIKFYRTLNDFAKQHASVIEFITKEWIDENIDFKIIEELFSVVLDKNQEDLIIQNLDLDRNVEVTGYSNWTGYIKSWVKDFFVYEKADGTILLNVDIEFETEYEIEILKTIEHDTSRYDYVYKTNPITGDVEMEMEYKLDYLIDREHDYIYEFPIFTGKFLLFIKDKKIETTYVFKDWEWS